MRRALNGLTLRAVWLTLEAWADDPPEFILFENVPRIATRGRWLLDQIKALLDHHGYISVETTHDCGEIGGLAQSRRRFLLVARHAAKVPPHLFEPERRRLRGVGEVLDLLPLPGDLAVGPMHRVPNLHWKTWVRLAFVEAGSDWRSLQKLRVADGHLTDFAIAPDVDLRRGALGVKRWGDTRSAAPQDPTDIHPRWTLGPPEMRFVWTVYVTGVKLRWFRFGSGQFGVDPMVRIGIATDLECVIRRWKPAHTQIVFNYGGVNTSRTEYDWFRFGQSHFGTDPMVTVKTTGGIQDT